MADPTDRLLSREEELELHRRLVERDPTAPSDVAAAFLAPLVDWLASTNSRKIPEDLYTEAAEDALIALVKNPQSFMPARGKGLLAYLRMSAQGDLQNLLRKEMRYRANCVSLESVEDSPQAGNYLGRDEDPSLPLRIREEAEQAEQNVLAPVRRGLTENESQALDLLLQGERRTRVYAKALGIDHLPKARQEVAVKRFKDKMKTRIKRKRGADGRSS